MVQTLFASNVPVFVVVHPATLIAMKPSKTGRRAPLLHLSALLLVTGSARAAPQREPATPATPSSEDVAEPATNTDGAALLDILSGNPTEIRLDGKKIGTTPINGHKVTPGTHDVTFVFSEGDAPTL